MGMAQAAEEWVARWIWTRQAGPANTWMRFRKAFALRVRPKAAPARISADSKYWLWVNGQLVVREGGLRRGPTPRGTYYDEIDLARHLVAGRNVLAALVWYWGREGFSHIDSGAGGFLFEMRIPAARGERLIVSDATWRARRDRSFLPAGEPNYRIPEWPIRFDARKAEPGWQQAGYDDRAWSRAVEKATPPAGPWGTLQRRPVPFWRDYGIKAYESVTRQGPGVYVGKLPYNMQLSACLDVEAPAGEEIRISTDHSYLGPLAWTYVTTEGKQRWESPWWLNGEQVRYEMSPRVRPLELGYRETGISAEFQGGFHCDDEELNVLWEKARRTTYVCVRDNYMDCPDRERAQWWGDAVNEVLQTFYAFSPEAYSHARKGMLEICRWQRPDGVLYSPVPSGNFNQELPCQMLAGVWGMWQYYLYTGDREAIAIAYPHVRRYLRLWQRRKDRRGFVVPRGEWVWIDWGERQDGYRIANALYVIAMDSAIAMARLVGRVADLPWLRRYRDEIARRFPREMWTGSGFGQDDRANALAVLAGLVRKHQAAPVRRLLHRVRNASPYMERYVEEALFRLGDAEGALARMRRRHREMVRHPCSTLWEGWSLEGKASCNHAWAGGPLYLLSAYVAGVRPTEPGFRRFQVVPDLGGLRSVDCTVPTVRGPIDVRIRRADGAISIGLTVPDRCAGDVGLAWPPAGYTSVLVDGRAIRPERGEQRPWASSDGEDKRFAWVRVGPGEHRIRGLLSDG